MLVDRKKVLQMLNCPVTGQKLHKLNTTELCADNNDALTYKIVNDLPVLIDFSTSVVKKNWVHETHGESLVKRRSTSIFTEKLRALISPVSPATLKNIDLLIHSLKSRNKHPTVLVVGGGTIGKGMEPLYQDKEIQIVAFDIYDTPNIQFIADAHQIPLPSSSFDCVIVQAVLEHVLSPHEVINEIQRVTNPGGFVYAETPFMQQVHEGPYDFMRFTESGHRFLFRNYKKLKSGSVSGPGTQLLWSFDYFVRSLARSRSAGKFVKLLFFWLIYFDRLIPEKFSIDGASGVYFLGKLAGSKLEASQIITYYQGAQ